MYICIRIRICGLKIVDSKSLVKQPKRYADDRKRTSKNHGYYLCLLILYKALYQLAAFKTKLRDLQGQNSVVGLGDTGKINKRERACVSTRA